MHPNPAPQHATAFTQTALLEGLARAGCAARSVIYAIIGVLAIRLAQGTGTAPHNDASPNAEGRVGSPPHVLSFDPPRCGIRPCRGSRSAAPSRLGPSAASTAS